MYLSMDTSTDTSTGSERVDSVPKSPYISQKNSIKDSAAFLGKITVEQLA